MAEQQITEDHELQEAQTRISHRISGFFLGLIGIMSLVAAVAYLALPGNDRHRPSGPSRRPLRPSPLRCTTRVVTGSSRARASRVHVRNGPVNLQTATRRH